jgi:hypothetical protein
MKIDLTTIPWKTHLPRHASCNPRCTLWWCILGTKISPPPVGPQSPRSLLFHFPGNPLSSTSSLCHSSSGRRPSRWCRHTFFSQQLSSSSLIEPMGRISLRSTMEAWMNPWRHKTRHMVTTRMGSNKEHPGFFLKYISFLHLFICSQAELIVEVKNYTFWLEQNLEFIDWFMILITMLIGLRNREETWWSVAWAYAHVSKLVIC